MFETELTRPEFTRTDRAPASRLSSFWNFGSRRAVELTVASDLRIVDVTRAAAKVWGLPLDRFEGMDFTSFFSNPEAARDLCTLAASNGFAEGHILELKSPSGEFTYLQCHAVRLVKDDSQILITAHNITDRKGMQAVLYESQQIFRHAFEFAHIGLGLLDFQGRLFEVNDRLASMVGLSKEELEGIDVRDIAAPEGDLSALDYLKKAMDDHGELSSYEKCYPSKENGDLWVEISFSLARGQASRPACVVASFRDISEHKRLNALLQQQASIDPLTKALTHTSFEERANVEVIRSGRQGYKLSLVLVDLDYFRLVNDKFGEAVGDQALAQCGDIIRKCLRMTDLFGRWGGEKFALLLPETGSAGAKRVAERVRASIEAFLFASDARLSASIGVASFRTGDSFFAMMNRTDDAVFRAKQAGRNQVVVDHKDLAKDSESKPEKSRFIELQWKRAYLSGQPEIDTEHKRLFHIANRLLATLDPDSAGVEFIPLVNDLVTEIKLHFAHEIQLLETVLYPQIEAHRQAHHKLIEEMDDLVARLKRMDATVGNLLGFVVHDIVARHILLEDREYFPWLAEHAPRIHLEKPAGDDTRAA